MAKNFEESIKDVHLKICLAILLFVYLFYFIAGFAFEDRASNPWWFNLLFGWSGLIVGIKLSEILYKD